MCIYKIQADIYNNYNKNGNKCYNLIPYLVGGPQLIKPYLINYVANNNNNSLQTNNN